MPRKKNGKWRGMTAARAIEILDPKHREHYGNIEVVNEACKMGMEALKMQIPQKPKSDEWGLPNRPTGNFV